MRTLDSLEYRCMLRDVEPDRFVVTLSPWGSAILIDRCFEYYDNPSKE